MPAIDPRETDPRVYGALVEFHNNFADAWTARQVGGHMRCEEAEAVAELLRLIGPGDGTAFLYWHANGETPGSGDTDPEDRHWWMREEYDAAAADRDHPATFPDEDNRCTECAQPVTLVGETFRHNGYDAADRERMRAWGNRPVHLR